MDSLEPTAETPSRIPRPTFTATSPRTPSIRKVPYSHMDRGATASRASGSYSPSSWPFPKSTKTSSVDLSVAAGQHRDERGGSADFDDMNRAENMRSGHRATASDASAFTITGSFRGRTRADACRDSVETQIYAPRYRDSIVSAEHSRPNSGKGPFFEPAEEIPERPMTPNPYSVLRKVSEVSEPDSDNDLSPKDDQQPSPELQHQETTHRLSTINTPQGPATHGRRSLNHMSAKPTANDSDMAHSTPILRDEAGRVISRVHPLSRASVLDSELQHSPYTVASSSVQADYGGSEAGAAANAPEGIVVLNSPDATEIAPKAGLPMRNFSLHSRRATTIQSEIPDLASLRLGPRIRHNRLPKSPSTAVNAGLGVPKSTKKLWTSLGRSRKMMIISAILLQLVILNLAASVTAVVVSHIEQGSAGTALVAWAAVSGVFVLTLAGLLVITFLQYRKMSENLVSDENWIEMHLRSRPLPPRPKSEERKKEDDGATEAWQKFAQDHTQLRRYVEFLETRVGVLEEGRTDMSGANNTTPNNIANGIGQTGGGNVDSDAGDNTPKVKKLNASSSMSHRQLLQPEPSLAGSESWQGSDNSGRIPRSDTKASILTELCEAVTEGYSPLSEQMPRGSPQVPQTPNMHTPSARPRDSVAHHLAVPGRAVIHQRGVRSVDLMGTRMDDI